MSDLTLATLDAGCTTGTLNLSGFNFTGPGYLSCTTDIPAEYIINCKNCDEQLRRKSQDLCAGCKDKLKAKLIYKWCSSGTEHHPEFYSKSSNYEEAVREWKVKQEKYYADNTVTFDNVASDTHTFNITGASTVVTGTLQFVTDTTPIDTIKAQYRISTA